MHPSLYANLLKKCCAMVEIPSGIVEAASFKLPVVNIGMRQDGKVKPINVIDTYFEKKNFKSNKKHLLKNLKILSKI